MKIISWDIGIINLAYCILEKKDDKFQIHKWDVINLVDDRSVCEHELRENKKCGKIGKYCVTDLDGNNHFTCPAHKNSYLPKLLKNKTKSKCEKCDTVATKTLDNKIGWCDDHLEKFHAKHIKKYKVKKIASQACKTQSIQDLAVSMYNKLDQIPELIDVDTVLIENQPQFGTLKLKSVASSLFSYFIMRGTIDKKRQMEIKCISPCKKLQIDDKQTKGKLDKAKNKRDGYVITKKLGEVYCKKLICEEDKKILEEHHKQDDMCDAFLQGFQYIFNPIPQHYATLLKEVAPTADTDVSIETIKVGKKSKDITSV